MFEVLDSVHDQLAGVARDLDPATLDGAGAKRLLAASVKLERLANTLKLLATKRIDDTGAWAAGSHRSAGAFVAAVAGTSVGAAKALLETARQVDELPAVAAAAREGRLSGEQLRTVAVAATAAPHREEHLLATAARTDLRGLREAAQRVLAAADPVALEAAHAKAHAERKVTTWTEGVVGHLELETTLVALGRIKAVLDDQTRRVFRRARQAGRRESFEAYAADALVELLTRAPAKTARTARTARRSPSRNVALHMCVDVEALRRGHTVDGETCEIPAIGPIPVSVAREYLTDAFLTLVLRKGVDIHSVTHLGRYIPTELRTAFLLRGLECINEDCNNRAYIEMDHHHDHAKGGPTSFDNVGPLCWPCHVKRTKGFILGPPDPVTPGTRVHDPPAA